MHEYEIGQVWKYRHRPHEPGSQLCVVAIEDDPVHGRIIHVYVVGLAIVNPQSPDGITEVIGHLPLTVAAMDATVETLEETTEDLPPFAEAYATWRAAFDNGDAGVWSVPLGDVITAMEAAINARR